MFRAAKVVPTAAVPDVLRIRLIAVGRVRERGVRDTIDEYLARVRRHVPCDEVELREERQADVAAAVARAAEGGTLVALDVGGDEVDSAAFARAIERMGSRGKGLVAFAVGGADGLPPAVLAAASWRLSLSRMTFPHRLARLVLVEQVYRAFTILRGEPYAH